MIEEKYLELINGEIDCVNSPSQSKKLQKYLEHNPDAQRFYHDLSVMSEALSHAKVVEPPQNLKKNIVNAIPIDKYAKHERHYAFRHYIDTFLFGNKPRYAYVFSAGVVIGIIVISLMFVFLSNKDFINIPDIYGTLRANFPSNFRIADKFEINEKEIKGDATLSYAEQTILVDLTVKTSQDINIMLGFNENDMNFLEFKKSNNLSNDLTVKPNSIQFSSNGENNYLIALGRKTSNLSPMYLKIYSSTGIAYERTLLNSREEK